MNELVQQQTFLRAIGFSAKEGEKGIFEKEYKNGYCIFVDFENNYISYGDKITAHSKTTQNFSQAENWVVLECINRLLEKGYQPKDITLEKTFPSGHGHSGRLDIFVEKEGKAFLMIECKTFGKEYNKELNNLHKDGGQLFTYFQNDTAAEVLMLYASRLGKNNHVDYVNTIVNIEDEYRETSNVKDFYDRWNKLPKQNGIFDTWVNPYGFQSRALTPNDLKDIKQADSSFIFNQFLEILRHNVVSDKPNAFNKIFTLFLCKIYDEKSTKANQELAFQWFYSPYEYQGEHHSQDNHITFQKRLTDLYSKGMKDFLEKEVTDISDEEFDKKYGSLDATVKKELKNTLTEIRLKKNNEFAIKEVFNDDSFEENAKVVKEVVELLQGYKIRYTKKQQYLSDFFELLLTTGLKQESGQFFTPVPIAQFIIKSLPVDKIVKQKLNKGKKDDLLPKVIDYASGSGHFITESMHEIQRIIDAENSDDYIQDTAKKIKNWQEDHFDWAFDYVYGIEKDYRLVKVGKVGCYLHGDGLAQIIHSDGLGNFSKTQEYKGLLKETQKDFPKDNQQFDIVVSNPPYSVASFKNNARKYYTEADFDIYDKLTDNSSEIECLFIERTKQLLKEGGIAGVILPSSILSNTGIYTKAREIILEYFDIIAIAELGSNTFMATGTNTVTLFLKRRNNYDVVNLKQRVLDFIQHKRDVTLNGIETPISCYVAHVWEGLSYEDYLTLLDKQPNEAVQQHELYKEYRQKIKSKNEADFWQLLLQSESEKRYYFIITYPQKVVIVKTGEKKAEKQFLGYEFSNRRGSEGIHPIQRGKEIHECTQLFDENSFTNPEKASTYIYKAFADNSFSENIPDSLKDNIGYQNLVDMLTFDRVDFEKNISLAVKKKVTIESQWEAVKLTRLMGIYRGASPRPIKQYLTNDVQGINWIKIGDAEPSSKYITKTKEKITNEGAKKSKFVQKGDFILSNSMSFGRPYILSIDGCIHDGWLLLSEFDERLNKDYLYYILSDGLAQEQFSGQARGGTTVDNLNIDKVSQVKIPLPPLAVQQKIVDEIAVLEQQEDKLNREIKSYQEIIEEYLSTLYHNGKKSIKLSDNEVFELSIGKRLLKSEILPNGQYPVYSANVFEPFGYVNESLITDFSVSSVLWGIDGDWMVNILEANQLFYPTDHCGVLRIKREDILLAKYLAFALRKEGGQIGFSRNKRASIRAVQNIKIPLPLLSEQQEIIQKVEKLETQIITLETQLTNMPNQKEVILKKYL